MCPRDYIDVSHGLLMWSRDCVDVSQERNKWRAVVNTVMNLLVPLVASQEGLRCLYV